MKEKNFILNSISPMIGVGTQTQELEKYRLDIKRVEEFLRKEYFPDADIRTIEVYRLNMRSLVQSDYGKSEDCTLTSITSLIDYYTKHKYEVQEIYDAVEKIALKYGYNGDTYGTINITIKKILGEAYKKFGLKQTAKEKLFKNLGYTYDFIKSRLIMSMPMILSMWNDGRSYYKNHSVTVVGYRIFQLEKDGKSIKCPTLMIYDNWAKTTSYLDFTQLGVISSIVY